MLHIWGGIDHFLFVLSLLLVVRRWKDLALLVTSFTVAHSITLILGALSIVPLEKWLGSAFVESTVALSIIYRHRANRLPSHTASGPQASMGAFRGSRQQRTHRGRRALVVFRTRVWVFLHAFLKRRCAARHWDSMCCN